MQKGFMQVAAWFEVAPEKLAGIKHESIVVADVYNNVKLLRATVACDCYVRVRCVRSGMQHTRHFRRRLKHHSVSHWQLLPRHSIFWHRAKTNTHRFSQRDDYNSVTSTPSTTDKLQRHDTHICFGIYIYYIQCCPEAGVSEGPQHSDKICRGYVSSRWNDL